MDGRDDDTRPFLDPALFERLKQHPDPDVAALAYVVERLVTERDRELERLQALG